MAERYEAFKRFDYRLNSNLVIQKETHGLSQNEPTGEPESLGGRILHSMGDKVVKLTTEEIRASVEKMRKELSEKKAGPRLVKGLTKAAAKRFRASMKKSLTVLDPEVSDVSSYRPSTKETMMLHEQLLNDVNKYLSGMSEDVFHSAAEEIIELCRDQRLSESEKKKGCENILDASISEEEFLRIYQVSVRLHDYLEPENVFISSEETEDTRAEKLNTTLSGVSVIFDEDEVEMNSDDENTVKIVEEEEEEDEEDDKMTGEESQEIRHLEARLDVEISDDELIQYNDSMNLNVKEIDSHWLQRKLGSIFNDAEIAVDVETQIMSVLNLPDLQECENKLVYILKYDNFNFAKLLLNNRWKIYFCTKLRQAQYPDEKTRILEQMKETAQGQDVLDQLETVKLRTNKEKEFAKSVRREAATLAGRLTSERDEEGELNNFVGSELAGPHLFAGPQPAADSRNKTTLIEKQGSSMDKQVTDAFMGTEVESSTTASSSKNKERPGDLTGYIPSNVVDLEQLVFADGPRLMSNSTVKLNEQSRRIEKKTYDEISVPPPVMQPSEMPDQKSLVSISELPEWCREPFSSVGIEKLNVIQSKIYPFAFKEKRKNMLICAPTGSGKTNIAVLTILALIEEYRNPETGLVDTRLFKVVYISPMKALVSEQVAAFQKRFSCYNLRVEELTGDVGMSRQQIEDTQIIVTTPEKWDVITRKAGERAYTQLVKLLIVDEVHLLHDVRGPVLEAVVARTLRQIEATQEYIRIVGLSATLPNYEDVGIFLRVSLKENDGLFVFGSHYRPVPLHQTYIGLREKKAIKRLATMNRVTYEKLLECAGRNQVLIFVHSRKETLKTAKTLRQIAMNEDTLTRFLEEDSASREILQTEADALKNADLRDLLPYGFAIHHAGLPRTDRRLIEDLFTDKHIQVLVSTATLAWGVNLPAHTVIIKGTQVYMPEKGRWVELSPLDVMQMMGRAGRPQYDSSGHGIIITNHGELQFYLSLNNQQLPIESQLISNLPDMVNAEICSGTIRTRADAAQWLGYTYLFVRLLRNPSLYGFPADVQEDDPMLERIRIDLAHSALVLLDKHLLIKYERKTGAIQSTPLGRVASAYYLKYPSIALYNEHLRSSLTDIELLHLFSLSHEFKYIPVRNEEKVELSKLIERVPIPVKGGSSSGVIEETSTKINILLQAYISQLKLEGYALVSDMVYVQQNACRIMRALFELVLRKKWANLANRCLLFCKMIARRMWSVSTPLRQFPNVLSEEVLRRLEKKDFPWEKYFDLTSAELGELLKSPKLGKLLNKLIHTIPKVELSAYIQPLTRSTLTLELTVIPDFKWDPKYNDPSGELFWIFVEDGDNETILYYDNVVLKQYQVEKENYELNIEFSFPILEPLPANYFLRWVSDRWIQSESLLPISLKSLILPEKSLPCTELLDLQPLPVISLGFPEAEALYFNESKHFNPIETQSLTALYNTDDNILLCAAPSIHGLRSAAEFAMLKILKSSSILKCVFLTPYESCAKLRTQTFRNRLGETLGVKVAQFTGDITIDLKSLSESNIIVSIPEYWDYVSRRWKSRKTIQQVTLFIVENLELLDSDVGPTMEVCISRMRYISAQLPKPIRMIGLSMPLANAYDVAEWLSVPPTGLFNFPNVRSDLKIVVEGYDIYHRQSRLIAMCKPAYSWIRRCCGVSYGAIIFCADRRQSKMVALDLILQAASDCLPKMFLHVSEEYINSFIESNISDEFLKQALQHGIGYIYEGMLKESEILKVLGLYESGAIQVLVLTESLAWEIEVSAHLVIIQDTLKYNSKEKKWSQYPLVNILKMASKAENKAIVSPGFSNSHSFGGDHRSAGSQMAGGSGENLPGVTIVMCASSKKDFYQKFKSEPLPVESRLDHSLANHINAEITLKTIESKQDGVDWLTWTYYYRRISKNPNFYGLRGVTPIHLSERLSEVVESAVEALEEAQCIKVSPEQNDTGMEYLSSLNLGLISGFYYIDYATIELLNKSIHANIKRRGLIEVLCAATEFSERVPVRFGEEDVFKKIALELGLKMGNLDKMEIMDSNVKTSLLLHAHVNRLALPYDLSYDQCVIVELSVRIIHALVDVISSNGWFFPALICMELCQMVVQGTTLSNSVLLQLPYFNEERVAIAKQHNINDIFDFINTEDDIRSAILKGLSTEQIQHVALHCNRYPIVNAEYLLAAESNGSLIEVKALDTKPLTGKKVDEQDRLVSTEPSPSADTRTYVLHPRNKALTLTLRIERVADSEDLGPVMSEHYPKPKDEQWWLVVGEPATNSLVAIKRIGMNKLETNVHLDFEAPVGAGDHNLVLNLICDSYVGCDQEYSFVIKVPQ